MRVEGTEIQGSIVLAVPLTGVEGPVHTLWLIELGVGLAVLLGVSGLGFVVVRRSLRPLREVETVAGAIAAGDLTQRVPERPVTTEVGSLSRSLNGMLAQIEYAFGARAASEARMRQFVADASHELRTPLADGPRLRRALPPGRGQRAARTSRAPCAGSRTRPPGWACSWRTCCCWPGSTRSARRAPTRST